MHVLYFDHIRYSRILITVISQDIYFTNTNFMQGTKQDHKQSLITTGFILSHLVKHSHVSQLAKHRCFVYMCKVQRSKWKDRYRKKSEFEYTRLHYEVWNLKPINFTFLFWHSPDQNNYSSLRPKRNPIDLKHVMQPESILSDFGHTQDILHIQM